jgi:hypothetical protein
VSDFADGSKEKTKLWQPFASAMAASVVYNMFQYPVVLKDWRHYNAEGSYSVIPTPHVFIDTDRTRFGNATRIFSFQKQIKPSTDKNFTRYADQIAKIA